MQKINFSLMLVSLLLTTQIQATVYENAEDKSIDRWSIYDNMPSGAEIKNIFINNSNAIEFKGEGTSNGYILGNWEGKEGAWNNKTEKTIKWSMNFEKDFVVYIRVMTSQGARFIYYTNSETSFGKKNNEYIHIGLGKASSNGTWQTITRDLESDLKKYEPNNAITAVNAFLIRGNGFVDDVALTNNQSNNAIYSIGAVSTDSELTLKMQGAFIKNSHGSFFIDADNDSTTGYSGGSVKGADYLVQHTALYRYPDDAKGWKWDKISSAVKTETTSSQITSKIPLNMMDITEDTINYIGAVSMPDWKNRINYREMLEYKIFEDVPIKQKEIIGVRAVKSTPLSKGKLFASPNGKDNICTDEIPCSLDTAFFNLHAGDVLFLKGGTYKVNHQLQISKKATKNKPIIVESYPGQKAILSGLVSSTNDLLAHPNKAFAGLRLSGDYIYLRNIEVKNMGHEGIIITGSHNIVEGCNLHHNFLPGVTIYGGRWGDDYKEYTAGYNLITDNIVHHNSDVGLAANGGNADGISVSSGKFNRVIHNTVYANSDDGIDVWRSNDSYVAYNIVYDNGRAGGDGNGIKAGGNINKNIGNGQRAIIMNNISYGNLRRGFDWNHGVDVQFKYNTSYKNKIVGFRGREEDNTLIQNNIAYSDGTDYQGVEGENNSWNSQAQLSFMNTNPNLKDFLKPISNSGFENMGAYANGQEEQNSNNNKIKIFVIGDSTVHNRDVGNHEMGWANRDALGIYMSMPSNLYNEGRSGASSKSYKTTSNNPLDDNNWAKTKNIIKNTNISNGAYLLIQFGHNDEHIELAGGTTPSEYYTELLEYVDWANENGLIPVLVTPVERRAKSAGNQNHRTHRAYAQKVRELADDKNVLLLDLEEKSWDVYNTYSDSKDINDEFAYDDNTHFSPNGAKIVGGWVKDLICEKDEKLCALFK